MFWICDGNSVDNGDISITAEWCLHRTKASSAAHPPQQQVLGGDTARTPDPNWPKWYPLSMVLCSAGTQEQLQEDEGMGGLTAFVFSAVPDEALLSWRWPNTPWPSEVWANSLLCFHTQLLLNLLNCLYLNPRDFSLSASQFCPHLTLGGASKPAAVCSLLQPGHPETGRQKANTYLWSHFSWLTKEGGKKNKRQFKQKWI